MPEIFTYINHKLTPDIVRIARRVGRAGRNRQAHSVASSTMRPGEGRVRPGGTHPVPEPTPPHWARACAPMSRLLGFAEPFLKRGARGVFLKGRDVANELVEARKAWRRLAMSTLPSRSDPEGNIVMVEATSRG